MNILAAFVIGIVAIVGSFFPRTSVWDKPSNNFGSTNFPASLDVLVNPGATDSVATVSHSSQHANANDAIEALEAKLGIGASTAVANTLFAGTGAGASLFTTHATATNLTLSGILNVTGLGTFGTLLSQGSTTIVGGLTITGNSTTTNATTTIIAATTATTTNFYGAGLTSCVGSNYITWSNGQFSCTSLSASQRPLLGISSSTNSLYLASTTDLVAGQSINWRGICQRGGSNSDLNMGYKLANQAGTTTIMNFGTIGDEIEVGEGVFMATTSVTITVEASAASNCDEGMQLTTIFYR
jgi:hypothetical protein